MTAQFLVHLVVEAGGPAGHLAGDDVDGGGQGRRLTGDEPGFHLSAQRPGAADHQAGIEQGVDHRLPAGGGLVGVDDDGHAARFEDAVHLLESLLQVLLKEALASLPAVRAVGVGHDLARFGGERGGEEFRVEMAHGALEPDVEEVGEVGVGHVVVVGRVGEHGVEVGFGVGELGGGGLGDGGRWDADER